MKIEIESLIELVAEVLETEPDSLSPGTVLEEIEDGIRSTPFGS